MKTDGATLIDPIVGSIIKSTRRSCESIVQINKSRYTGRVLQDARKSTLLMISPWLWSDTPVHWVHRCGPGGSMRACHAAGPGSIPGLYKFPGWGFSGFFLTYETNVGKF